MIHLENIKSSDRHKIAYFLRRDKSICAKLGMLTSGNQEEILGRSKFWTRVMSSGTGERRLAIRKLSTEPR